MREKFQKVESTLTIYIRTECINLRVYLYLRNILNMNNLQCNCKWSHQIIKHVLMHYLTFSIRNVMKCWINELLNYYFDSEKFQDDDQNNNENETVETV